LKKVTVVKPNEVEVKPFILNDFMQSNTTKSSMKKISKKELKTIADRLKLRYSEKEIIFAKKLIHQLCK
jgi:hypothetical protein